MAQKPLPTVPYRPDPARNTVIDCRPGFTGPYLEGDGTEDSTCGSCGALLIRGQIIAYLALYICCYQCGVYNVADGRASRD